jgi:PAS domain S-box-containing protein
LEKYNVPGLHLSLRDTGILPKSETPAPYKKCLLEWCPMTNPPCENPDCIPAESSNPVVFTLDNQGKITSVSPGCADMLGFSPDKMMGQPLSAFVLPGEKDRVSEMHGRENPEKTPYSCFHVVGKDGSTHPALAISRSVFDGRDETGMFGLIGEISTDKQAEKIIRQTNLMMNRLNSIVRHDINNQLTVLNGYLTLMEPDDSTLRSSDIIRILLGATEKIQRMITFTKEYKDIGTQSPKWTSLYEMFQSVRSTFSVRSIPIQAEPACRDLELFCDPMFAKVFLNLIDNSLRHGKTVTEISLRWRREDGDVIIVYEDNGIGISDALRPTLFHPGKGNKTGNGLFLVHEILVIPGFTIAETGTPGTGARFEIRVPAGSFRVKEKKG